MQIYGRRMFQTEGMANCKDSEAGVCGSWETAWAIAWLEHMRLRAENDRRNERERVSGTLQPYKLWQDLGFHSLYYACVRVQSVQLYVTLWAIAHQDPLSLKISKQEYWSGQPFPSPEDLPNPGMEPGSPVLQADSLLSEPPEKPILSIMGSNRKFLSWSMKATVRHICFDVQIGICSDLLEPYYSGY